MIHVAGGTYREICQFPIWNEFFGSGGRAAAMLAGLSDKVLLTTFSSKAREEARRYLADCFNFGIATLADGPEVAFEYLHPLRSTSVSSERCSDQRIVSVSDPVVLRFGCWEGDIKVDANRAVYDPQSPLDPRPFAENGSRAERLAIICNTEEGRQLTGAMTHEAVASALLRSADVVVLKAGPAGAFVCTRHEPVIHVPAYKTDRVFSIGSGDVFSAVFAHYWAEQGSAAGTAADLASKATAWYCAASTFPTGMDWEANAPIEWRAATQPKRKPKIYLAGPFFAIQQLWFIEETLEELERMGLEVFSPFHDVGSPPSSHEVAERDLDGLRDSDVVLAILDGLDPGTIFEVGYARSLGIPVVALQQERGTEDMKMFEGTGVLIERDFATAIYKTYWKATEQAA